MYPCWYEGGDAPLFHRQASAFAEASLACLAFVHDPVGNRTTNGSLFNPANQLTADANFTYEYDDNGNLSRKTLLATGDHTAYTYDAENRLIQVEQFAAGNPTPFATSSYRYDGLGRRIEKVGNGITRRYIYDGEDILLEYDETNTLQARYTHGPGIDEPVAMQRGGSDFFYHQDGLGTVTDLTDSAGALAQSYAYDAWGNILDETGTVENPYTYTGREFDAETGLYYYRARYYDSTTGRFIEKDPLGLKGSDVNLYAYVNNNPVNVIDPTGLLGCRDCTRAKPLPANSPECDEYNDRKYLGAGLKCFCKCAGDGVWAQQVRGCLACERDQGTDMAQAHDRCYTAAGGAGNGPTFTLARCYLKCVGR